MTINYCDFINGNDSTGNGSYSTPYQTITKASTGLTGGDEVRVAKSPAPTALTGTISFTQRSTSITGSGTAFSTELTIGDFVEGGDGQWYEVITITNNTTAVLYKVYAGASASGVSSRKLGITSTGAAASSSTAVQTISANGTSSANLKISGGWDLSSQTQTGQTYFRQMHSTFATRNGYGLYIESKSYTEIERLHFLRYNYGIYYSNSYNNTCTSPTCNSNSQYGIYYAGPQNNIKGTLTTSGNTSGAINAVNGINYIQAASIAESTKVGGLGDYTNARIYINNIGGYSQIWTDGGNVVSQGATAGGTGNEWKMNVTSSKRSYKYPLTMTLARVAVAANAQVTVTCYFKKSNATGIVGSLVCRGGQIAGVDTDVSTTCPDDTNRNNVQIQFQPTEAGVVEIEAWAWYVSGTTYNVIVDDIAISQA